MSTETFHLTPSSLTLEIHKKASLTGSFYLTCAHQGQLSLFYNFKLTFMLKLGQDSLLLPASKIVAKHLIMRGNIWTQIFHVRDDKREGINWRRFKIQITIHSTCYCVSHKYAYYGLDLPDTVLAPPHNSASRSSCSNTQLCWVWHNHITKTQITIR